MEGLFCCTLGPGKRWELPGGGNKEFLRIILNFSGAASSGPLPQLCLPLEVKPKPRQLHKVEENSIFLTSRSPQSRSFPAGSGGLGMPSWRWKSHSRSFWRVQGLVPGSRCSRNVPVVGRDLAPGFPEREGNKHPRIYCGAIGCFFNVEIPGKSCLI